VVLTSNLGAREMERLTEEPLGFSSRASQLGEMLDKHLY
jgi:hypothetical protein